MDLTSFIQIIPNFTKNKLFKPSEGSLMWAPYSTGAMAVSGSQTYHIFPRNMKLMLGPRGLNSLEGRNNALLLLGPSYEILKSCY